MERWDGGRGEGSEVELGGWGDEGEHVGVSKAVRTILGKDVIVFDLETSPTLA